MPFETLYFYILITAAIVNLAQIFFYGLQENNRPNILFGIVFLFFAFAYTKPQEWIQWGIFIVSAVGFIGTLTGFADSLKPNWLNYLLMFVYLIVFISNAVYFYNLI